MTNQLNTLLLNDKQYQELVQKGEDLLKEVVKRGVAERADAVEGVYTKKLSEYREELKAFAGKRLEEAESALNAVRFEFKSALYDNPQQEQLRRDDLRARLNLFNEGDIVGYIDHLKPDDVTLFDLNLIEETAQKKLQGNDLDRAAMKIEAVKNATLVDSEKQQQLEERYIYWRGLSPIRLDGHAYVYDSEHDEMIIRDHNKEFNEIIQKIKQRDADSAKKKRR